MIYKFRAWDRTTHEDGVMVPWKDLKEFSCEIIFMNLSEVVLMQFTGQLDKNGSEIYEGDIIKYQGGDIESGTALVKYFGSANNLVFDWIEQSTPIPDMFTAMLYFGCSDELEIIGNKFENSELLYN